MIEATWRAIDAHAPVLVDDFGALVQRQRRARLRSALGWQLCSDLPRVANTDQCVDSDDDDDHSVEVAAATIIASCEVRT
jgi:hypothetical protein